MSHARHSCIKLGTGRRSLDPPGFGRQRPSEPFEDLSRLSLRCQMTGSAPLAQQGHTLTFGLEKPRRIACHDPSMLGHGRQAERRGREAAASEMRALQNLQLLGRRRRESLVGSEPPACAATIFLAVGTDKEKSPLGRRPFPHIARSQCCERGCQIRAGHATGMVFRIEPEPVRVLSLGLAVDQLYAPSILGQPCYGRALHCRHIDGGVESRLHRPFGQRMSSIRAGCAPVPARPSPAFRLSSRQNLRVGALIPRRRRSRRCRPALNWPQSRRRRCSKRHRPPRRPCPLSPPKVTARADRRAPR